MDANLKAFIYVSIIILIFMNVTILFKGKIISFLKNKIKKIFKKNIVTLSDYEEFIYQMSLALDYLSKNYIGTLIVAENTVSLKKYINIGYFVNAQFNSEFLINVFANKKSSIHDGGVIVKGLKIISISSYFPITTNKITTNFGARHRAAIGITEETDSVAIIISETTGKISWSANGKIKSLENFNNENLSAQLFKIFNFYIK